MASPLYFIETAGRIHGRRCKWFLEVDRDTNSRAAVIDLIATGEAHPVKVIEVIEPCAEYPRGQVLDVTKEIVAEAMAGIVPDPIDHQALAFDHAHDLRKHEERV